VSVSLQPLVIIKVIAAINRGIRESKKWLRHHDVAAQKLPKSDPTNASATVKPR
jgi:hypothetical protein